jgi:hypothetical protein
MRKKGRYGFFWEPNHFGFKNKEKYLLIHVISASLQSARRIAYKGVREQGFSQGALWTTSATHEGDPFLANKKSGIERAFVPLDFGIMPSGWLDKMNSEWPKTNPFYHQPTYYDEASS